MSKTQLIARTLTYFVLTIAIVLLTTIPWGGIQ